MSADVVGGIMCFELFFERILETGGSLEQRVLGGLLGCRLENVGLHTCHRPERNQHVTSSKSFGRGGNLFASSVLDLVHVTLQRSLMAWACQGIEQI